MYDNENPKKGKYSHSLKALQKDLGHVGDVVHLDLIQIHVLEIQHKICLYLTVVTVFDNNTSYFYLA